MKNDNYYNEFDPFAADWLRMLIAERVIPGGYVDDRDMRDVDPSFLDGFRQCHFFAGIGGWAEALRLAGYADVEGLWTGSCPCQPFSAAGRGMGLADERHLWPAFFHLIHECCPTIIFGEQVASPAGLGWLDLVCSDLEGAGYAVGAADLCAAGVGAPHIRQRLWWVAHSEGRSTTIKSEQPQSSDESGGFKFVRVGAGTSSRIGYGARPEGDSPMRADCSSPVRDHGELADADQQRHDRTGARSPRRDEPADGSGIVGYASGKGSALGPITNERRGFVRHEGQASAASSHWGSVEWLPCRDGKARPTQSGLQPLAHGVLNRVGTLRGAGNAIVPQAAAEFIRAALDP